MPYPENVDKFTDKLNKLEGNTYVVEEVVNLTDGVYESELQHDNISLSSLNIYTGSKLTGNKIDTYTLSTPSTTPWKKIIKIYSNITPLYISYQTTGDTVESEDINKVQDSVTNIETEVDRYKNSNDLRASNTENRLTTVENNKAEKTYTDTRLLTKADKSDTFTKEEVLQKIQDLIGTAPQTLDTFKEIADALADDPHFATTIMNLLSNKVDKVQGKQLSTEDYTTLEKQKLAGVQDNANNYNHPTTHPANMITEDSTHRWTTDSEKANWNTVSNKSDTGHKHIKADITDFPSIPTKVSQLTNDSNFVTETQLGNAGYGDMLKSVYDKNNNGIVDKSEDSNTVGGKSASDFMLKGPITWNQLKGV